MRQIGPDAGRAAPRSRAMGSAWRHGGEADEEQPENEQRDEGEHRPSDQRVLVGAHGSNCGRLCERGRGFTVLCAGRRVDAAVARCGERSGRVVFALDFVRVRLGRRTIAGVVFVPLAAGAGGGGAGVGATVVAGAGAVAGGGGGWRWRRGGGFGFASGFGGGGGLGSGPDAAEAATAVVVKASAIAHPNEQARASASVAAPKRRELGGPAPARRLIRS